jgi:hypothetical protein
MPSRLLQNYIAKPKASLPVPVVPTVQPIVAPTLALTDTQTRNPVIETQRPPISAHSPFSALDVWPSIDGATIITWQQNRLFKEQLSSDTHLILEFSYSLAPDSWIFVTECPITYFLQDKKKRFQGQTIEGAYRIKLASLSHTYTSEPIRLFQKLSYTEYRTALKTIRAENRQIYHKSPGWLLKKRWMGVRCNSCNDLMTETSTADRCNICYGTGFVGGYFKPVQCGMEITVKGSADQVDNSRGPINDKPVQGRITALYSPETGDVWCDSLTGSRYRVLGHQVICHQRSLPLVLMAQMRHIPASDIVYSVKVEG